MRVQILNWATFCFSFLITKFVSLDIVLSLSISQQGQSNNIFEIQSLNNFYFKYLHFENTIL